MTAENNVERQALMCPHCANQFLNMLAEELAFSIPAKVLLPIFLEVMEADHAAHQVCPDVLLAARKVSWKPSKKPAIHLKRMKAAVESAFPSFPEVPVENRSRFD